jgi:hypothetical protein
MDDTPDDDSAISRCSGLREDKLEAMRSYADVLSRSCEPT